MSDAVAARLRQYVRDGGRLFATFETGLYDDTGTRRKEFALADVFGMADAGRVAGPIALGFHEAHRDTSVAGWPGPGVRPGIGPTTRR